MGRKAKPTGLRILEGNRSKRPLPAGEPVFQAANCPPPPGDLDAEAAAFWRRYSALLQSAGCITVADMTSFEVLCRTWSQWRRLALLEQSGEAEPSDFGSLNQSRLTLLKYFSEFGMTPSSRTRIKATAGKVDDPLESFLKQG